MSRILIWLLGGGTAVAGAAVAGWIVMDQQRADPPVPPTTPRVEPVETVARAPEPGAPAQAPTAEDPPSPPPTIAPTVEGPSAAEAIAPPPAAAGPTPPSFDVVRVARDGAALVAGSAAPGAAVTLRVDGLAVAETAADAAGQFVAMFNLGTSDAIQVMTLEMSGADGVAIASADTVVLTPRPAEAVEALAAAPREPGAAPVSTALTSMQGVGVQGAAPVQELVVAQADEAVPLTEIEGRTETRLALTSPGAEDTVPRAAQPEGPTDPEPTVEASGPAVESGPSTVENGAAPSVAPLDEAIATGLPQVGEGPQTDLAADVDRAPLPAIPQPPEAAAPGAAPLPDPTAPPERIADAELAVPETSDLPTAFLVRGSGAVEVIDRAPQVMDNVVIDSISYSAGGDVQIAGRAARAEPDASLRIYLNNRPIAVARAERGDWASDLPHVDPGVYTLRVDQLNAAGGVVSRFETPFQREDPALVAEAQAQLAQTQTQTGAGTGVQAPPQPVAAEPATIAQAADPQAPASQARSEPDGTTAAPVSATAPTQDVAGPAARTGVPPVSLITVQPGHTLWAISNERYGAGELYVLIYRANRNQIRDPDLIYPGQIFALPEQ